jgi:hypothetical protein
VQMKTEKQFDPIQMAENLVNEWLREAAGRPVTSSLSSLSFRVITALEYAYLCGKYGINPKPLMDDVDMD